MVTNFLIVFFADDRMIRSKDDGSNYRKIIYDKPLATNLNLLTKNHDSNVKLFETENRKMTRYFFNLNFY